MAGIGTPKLPLKKLVLASVLSILKWCVLREKHCLFDLIFPDTNLCYILWQDIWIKALHFYMFSWNNNFVVMQLSSDLGQTIEYVQYALFEAKRAKVWLILVISIFFFLKYKAFWEKVSRFLAIIPSVYLIKLPDEKYFNSKSASDLFIRSAFEKVIAFRTTTLQNIWCVLFYYPSSKNLYETIVSASEYSSLTGFNAVIISA